MPPSPSSDLIYFEQLSRSLAFRDCAESPSRSAMSRLDVADLVATPVATLPKQRKLDQQPSLYSQRLLTPLCAELCAPATMGKLSAFQAKPPPKSSSSSSFSLAPGEKERKPEVQLWELQRDAAARLASGDLQGALRSSRECVKFSTSCFGLAEHSRTIYSYILLAEASLANGHVGPAEALFEHVLVLVGRLGPHSRLVTSRSPSLVRLAIISLLNLAFIKQKSSLPHRALGLYERVLVSSCAPSPLPLLRTLPSAPVDRQLLYLLRLLTLIRFDTSPFCTLVRLMAWRRSPTSSSRSRIATARLEICT